MTTTTRATPAVRVLAARYGVSLGTVAGTGAGGRITTVDVTRAAHDDATFRALFGMTDQPATTPITVATPITTSTLAEDALYAALFGGG